MNFEWRQNQRTFVSSPILISKQLQQHKSIAPKTTGKWNMDSFGSFTVLAISGLLSETVTSTPRGIRACRCQISPFSISCPFSLCGKRSV